MTLTSREIQVLRLLCLGKQAKLIAFELGVTENTIWFFKRRIKEKTGEVELTGLIRYAILNGHLSLDEFFNTSSLPLPSASSRQNVSPSSHLVRLSPSPGRLRKDRPSIDTP